MNGKRYAVFLYEQHDQRGGWMDLKTLADTVKEALAIEVGDNMDFGEIVDLREAKVVANWEDGAWVDTLCIRWSCQTPVVPPNINYDVPAADVQKQIEAYVMHRLELKNPGPSNCTDLYIAALREVMAEQLYAMYQKIKDMTI